MVSLSNHQPPQRAPFDKLRMSGKGLRGEFAIVPHTGLMPVDISRHSRLGLGGEPDAAGKAASGPLARCRAGGRLDQCRQVMGYKAEEIVFVWPFNRYSATTVKLRVPGWSRLTSNLALCEFVLTVLTTVL